MAAPGSAAPAQENRFDWGSLDKIPAWIAAFAGIVFVTGFVVEISFLDRFGLRESGVEFFKAKYLHVGILLLLFSCFVALPCLSIIYLHYRTRAHAIAIDHALDKTTDLPPFVLNRPMAWLAANILCLTYVFAVLVSPRTVLDRKQFLALILVVTIVSPWTALWIANKLGAVGERRRVLRERLLVISCLPVLAADFAALWGGPFRMIAECLYYGGYSYFIFSIRVFEIAHRLKVWAYRMPDANARLAWWTAGACVLAATYYLSIVSFAYRVYPFIPADKGGGDYTEAAMVTIRLHDRAALPFEMLDRGPTSPAPASTADMPLIQSKPLIIIEETPGSVYAADPADAGGPYNWRRGSIPKIIQITRSDIASMVYASRYQLSR